MSTNTTDTSKASIWEFKKYKEYEWFRFLVIKLISLVILYIAVHWIIDAKNLKYGYEYSKMDKQQIQQINRIYFDSTGLHQTPSTTSAATGVDSSGVVKPVLPPVADRAVKKTEPCIRAIRYISNEYNNKIDTLQLDSIRGYLCSAASAFEATSFLSDVRLQVKSYFWLTGPMVYFEIIFWSIFGVVCSLLFNLGLVSRGSTTNLSNARTEFDSSEIPSQVAKILYAPICTLVIVLGYNFFNDENIVDISSSKGVIVFAFIGGFYSSRLIAFLDRLKEVLLPHGSTPDPSSNPDNPVLLGDVTIELQLDESFAPEDLKNDIIETGLGDATVTLQNDKGENAIIAGRKGEDQSSVFVVSQIKPGKYTIKASWSKEINGVPVNLEAVQEADIRSGDTPVIVIVKKAKDEG